MVEREHIARKDPPCPALKRYGDICGSDRVGATGYCFAHDPERAEWRAMADAKKCAELVNTARYR